MGSESCVACGARATSTVAGRAYCDHHGTRHGAWWKRTGQATGVLVAGLVALVLATGGAAPALGKALGTGASTALGVALAVVPAALWLSVFYLQDRAHPEPKWLLLRVCVLGGLAAGAVGQPLVQGVFRLSEWTGGGVLLDLAAGVLVVGAVQESLKYAAVRHSVYESPEYDEPIDGIVYAAAAGLGYAAVANAGRVLATPGMDLGYVAWRSTIDALAQASCAGVAGAFLGRAKFEARPAWWLPVGVLLAAALNGVVSTALGVLSRRGIDPTPLRGLLAAAAVAIATFTVLLRLMGRAERRANAAAAAGEPAAPRPVAGSRRREWTVAGVVLALLAAGWALRASHWRASTTVTAGGVGVEIPASWAASVDASAPLALVAEEPGSGDTFPTRVTLRRVPAVAAGQEPSTLESFTAQRTASPGPAESSDFTVVRVRRATAAGRVPAMVVEYGYVAPPPEGAPASALPSVVRARDLVFRWGDDWGLLTFAADAGRFAADRWIWDRAVESLTLPGEAR